MHEGFVVKVARPDGLVFCAEMGSGFETEAAAEERAGFWRELGFGATVVTAEQHYAEQSAAIHRYLARERECGSFPQRTSRRSGW